MKFIKSAAHLLTIALLIFIIFHAIRFIYNYRRENAVLKQIVERLEADSRIAEVLVTKIQYDEKNRRNLTTIKFLEYDHSGTPLVPKYFTFAGNIIQFQSLVIRFEDVHIRAAHIMKGKSAYIFWKVFMLDGDKTQEFEITPVGTVPEGYRIERESDYFEKDLWEQFWKLSIDPQKYKKSGVKNAQIEAPGTMFIPGVLYTIKIEHDGGMRIDSQRLSPILRNEKII